MPDDPTLSQAVDFADEVRALHTVLRTLDVDQWDEPTGFKGWTAQDILVHLHFWNLAADYSLVDPDALTTIVERIAKSGSMRAVERETVPERAFALLAIWLEHVEDMERRWSVLEPKTRVSWVGPDMSVRSSMTARQMEHWAHGQALYDLMGKERQDTTRLRNIVVLGVNTFGWSFQVRNQPVPGLMPHLNLIAPTGTIWNYGDSDTDSISGTATEFCQVVTQTRNVADTALQIDGPVARQWMESAQCFAGGPETPPAPGTRVVRGV